MIQEQLQWASIIYQGECPSGIRVLGPQSVELFGKVWEVLPCWKRWATGPWELQKPRSFPVISLCFVGVDKDVSFRLLHLRHGDSNPFQP